MSSGVVIQILVDLIFLAGFTVTWLRLAKPPKDDPRLSRGLQLLQQKIAVLEDLGDQTEKQVQQITQLIDGKSREIQNQIATADDQIRKIENMMGKSLEVANIFQDKIPHEEIIDRKSTMKYVKAARMAHQGQTIDEIAEQVDLSRAEIEFVAKVNRNQLQFSEEDLPEWAKASMASVEQPAAVPRPTLATMKSRDLPAKASLSQLGDKFRQATRGSSEPAESLSVPTPTMTVTPIPAPPAAPAPLGPPAAAPVARVSVAPAIQPSVPAPAPAKAPVNEGPVVKKVIFPRMDELHKKELKKMIDRNLG